MDPRVKPEDDRRESPRITEWANAKVLILFDFKYLLNLIVINQLADVIFDFLLKSG